MAGNVGIPQHLMAGNVGIPQHLMAGNVGIPATFDGKRRELV